MDDIDILVLVVLAVAVVAAVIGLFAGATVYFFGSLGVLLAYVGVAYLAYVTYGR